MCGRIIDSINNCETFNSMICKLHAYSWGVRFQPQFQANETSTITEDCKTTLGPILSKEEPFGRLPTVTEIERSYGEKMAAGWRWKPDLIVTGPRRAIDTVGRGERRARRGKGEGWRGLTAVDAIDD